MIGVPVDLFLLYVISSCSMSLVSFFSASLFIYLFIYLFIFYLFIFGCVGSLLLRVGFL